VSSSSFRSELILGGQKSGKSARAELLAAEWIAKAPDRRCVLLATGLALDEEMRCRIARHQLDRAVRVPAMQTHEAPYQLAAAIRQHSAPDALVVVDCLTMWLTNWLMPAQAPQGSWRDECAAFLEALAQCTGPIVLVSNEIGLGVVPMQKEVREFVDALGRFNQRVARLCTDVTLMAAGLPLSLK